MEASVKILILMILGLASLTEYQVTCSVLTDDVTNILVRHSRSLIDDGEKVMERLHNKIGERTILMKSSSSNYFGIDFQTCADIRDELSEASALLQGGKQLYETIITQYNKLTGCFVSKSKFNCWAQVIKDLPVFLSKYKPLVACYTNNVYYMTEVLDYDIYKCFGSNIPKPVAPPKTFEQCLKDVA